MDVGRELFEMQLYALAERFSIRGWEGVFVTTPEETAAQQVFQGQTPNPRWEVWMQKEGHHSLDARHPSRKGVPLRAALWFDQNGADNATAESMAYRLAITVAAREAHETLEWARYDGHLLVDPHIAEEVDPASEAIAEYLRLGG